MVEHVRPGRRGRAPCWPWEGAPALPALQVDNAKALFDAVALDRVVEVSRQLHAQGLASMLTLPASGKADHQEGELERYDVRRHMRVALQPLIDWTESDDVAAALSAHYQVGAEPARAILAAMRRAWTEHLDTSWTGPLIDGRPASVAVRLAAQLVATRLQLARLWDRPPSYDLEHRDAALLFAGHYFAEAPLDRLWGRDADDLGEDPIGRWFWPCWVALLDQMEPDSLADTTLRL